MLSLKASAVPTYWRPVAEFTSAAMLSAERAKERHTHKRRRLEQEKEKEDEVPVCADDLYIGAEETVEMINLVKDDSGVPHITTHCNATVQCDLIKNRNVYSIEQFRDDDKAIAYYTGFENFYHFMYVFTLLGPSGNDLGITQVTIPPQDQLFLTLMKYPN